MAGRVSGKVALVTGGGGRNWPCHGVSFPLAGSRTFWQDLAGRFA
jgi:hypothetical protein